MNYIGWAEVALGVGAIVLTLVLFWSERRSKALSYAVFSNRSLVNVPTKFPIKVLYEESLVSCPQLLVWRLVNSGTKPIEVDDFESPIAFQPKGSKVLSSNVTLTRPSAFRPKIEQDGETVFLKPTLLNPGDMVEVQMLLDGQPAEFSMESRISGIAQINRIEISRTSWDQPWRFSWFDKVISTLPALVGVFFGVTLYINGDQLWEQIIGVLLLFCTAVIYPWHILRSNRRNSLFLEVKRDDPTADDQRR